MDEFGWRKRQPTVLVADRKPGEEVQVDFGSMGTMHDPETGLTLWQRVEEDAVRWGKSDRWSIEIPPAANTTPRSR